MENVLVQKFGLRSLRLELTNEGVMRKERSLLIIGSSEKLYPYANLGVDVEKKSNNEGVSTIMIMLVMLGAFGFILVNDIKAGRQVSFLYIGMAIFCVLVIIHTIQKYISRTYEITGGNESLSMYRYNASEEKTIAFIEEIKLRVKANLVKRYNDLIADIKPNPVLNPEPVSAGYKLSDEEFRELRRKNDHLFSSLFESLIVGSTEEKQSRT